MLKLIFYLVTPKLNCWNITGTNHLRDAIDLKNNYPEALANMGDIYLEKDYAKDALASYKAAHELDPESVYT